MTIQSNVHPDRSVDQNVPETLIHDVRELLSREPAVASLMSIFEGKLETIPTLLGYVLSASVPIASERTALQLLCTSVFEKDSTALDAALSDLQVTAGYNVEPGGQAATLLFSRGIHAMLGHRVSHSLWQDKKFDLSLACKTIFGRAFSTDIHPAARFGKRIWLDHGLGFVVGETSIVEDNVSIWHGVTLGSTLKNASSSRHPRIHRGVTIGAGAIILGDIDIGEFSVIAAGAVVLKSVPPRSTVAGVPAKQKTRNASSFAGFKPELGGTN